MDDYTKRDLKWYYGICGKPAKDTVALFKQYFCAMKRVKKFKDSDDVQWVICYPMSYHLIFIVSMSDNNGQLLFQFLCTNNSFSIQ